MMARPFFTLTSAHVRRQREGIHGTSERGGMIVREAQRACEALGSLQPGDVLKRCYNVGGVIQCENDSQRAARLASAPMAAAWRYEPETETIRTVPENYMVARLGCDAALDRDRNGEALARVPVMQAALRDALRFVAGFEGDEMQDGIDGPDGLLARLRAALGAEG